MNTYAAQIKNGIVTRVIVGTSEWATERLGGVWVASATKVGVGWEQYDGGLRPPAPYPSWSWNSGAWTTPVLYPDDGRAYTWNEAERDWIPEEPNV